MDGDAIRQALDKIEEELDLRRQQVAKLEKAASALRGLSGDGEVQEDRRSDSPGVGQADMFPEPPDVDAPRGRDAIREILKEREGEWVDMKTLTDEMVSRGWVRSARPREAVRTSADRLERDDPLVEKKRGIYRLIREPGHYDVVPLTQEGGERPDDGADR